MSEAAEKLVSAQMRVGKFNPNASTPLLYGMHLPGIIMVYGVPYNDDSVSVPCYRVGSDPRIGYNTAVWTEKEPA